MKYLRKENDRIDTKSEHTLVCHILHLVVSEFFFSTFPLVAVRALIRIVQRERRMKPSVLFPS